MTYLYEFWNFLKDNFILIIVIFAIFIWICILFWNVVKEWAKLIRAWFGRLWKVIKRFFSGLLLLFAIICIGFALWFFSSDILELYGILSDQIKDINTPVPDPIKGAVKSADKYFGIAIRYFGIVAAAGAIIGYIIAIARNLISDNQNKISEQGRIAEQISRAIDQIGAYKQNFDNNKDNKPNIEARVGGIYSLERIAKDSDGDYKKIMDILCAYVRVTAPIEESEPANPLKKENPKIKIREDIQAAIDVLGTKKGALMLWNRDKFRVNLENCDLSNYRFSELKFNTYTDSKSGAIFDKSLFHRAEFHRADLSYVSFDGADLTEANFEYTKLIGARFEGTIFKDTEVHSADLSKAEELTSEQVKEMIGDKNTKLPNGLKLSRIEEIPI